MKKQKFFDPVSIMQEYGRTAQSMMIGQIYSRGVGASVSMSSSVFSSEEKDVHLRTEQEIVQDYSGLSR